MDGVLVNFAMLLGLDSLHHSSFRHHCCLVFFIYTADSDAASNVLPRFETDGNFSNTSHHFPSWFLHRSTFYYFINMSILRGDPSPPYSFPQRLQQLAYARWRSGLAAAFITAHWTTPQLDAFHTHNVSRCLLRRYLHFHGIPTTPTMHIVRHAKNPTCSTTLPLQRI